MELDQFIEGLSTHNVLGMIQDEPALMKPLFVPCGAELSPNVSWHTVILF